MTQFGAERSLKGAVFFYVVYSVLGFVVTMGIGLVFIPYLQLDVIGASELGAKLGRAVGIVFSAGLTLLILLEKRLFVRIGYLMLLPLSAVVGVWGGLLPSLLVPAFLSTRGVLGAKEEKEEVATIPKASNVPSTETVKSPMLKPTAEIAKKENIVPQVKVTK